MQDNPTTPIIDPASPAIVGLKAYEQLLNRFFFDLVSEAQRQQLQASAHQLQRIPARLSFAFSCLEPALRNMFWWLYHSREDSNFTYDLTERNKGYLSSFIAVISGRPAPEIRGYIEELNNDLALQHHVQQLSAQRGDANLDLNARYSRRLGWYALVRAFKPKVVVETGVDKGLGSCVLASALLRNRCEGFPGSYYGTDIDPNAGYLFAGEYRSAGTILYGDSITSLRSFSQPIDLFINDSDHSAEYEANEYITVQNKLSANALIIADNAHVTDKLYQFAIQTGRQFLFFREDPKDHWYPGAGMGVAFPTPCTSTAELHTAPAADSEAPCPNPTATPPAIATPQHKDFACLFLNTYYDEFLVNHYTHNAALLHAGYAEQLAALQTSCFGDSDFYSEGLRKAGWRTEDAVINCAPLQRAWAAERGQQFDPLGTVLRQIEEFQPQVVYCQDMHFTPPALLEELRRRGIIVVGQIASTFQGIHFDLYDIVVTAVPVLADYLRSIGVKAYYQPLAFAPKVLTRLQHAPWERRTHRLSFVGNLAGPQHPFRSQLLERVAQELDIKMWGGRLEYTAEDSPLRRRHQGTAWGVDMFQRLADSQITLNVHADMPLPDGRNATALAANNMRLFEATGCGALLVTDYRPNLSRFFKLGEEIVAYRSIDECCSLIRYYLEHPDEAREIARNGQRRTLEEHAYDLRMSSTAELLERHLRLTHDLQTFLPPDPAKLSYGYTQISPHGVSQAQQDSWKDPSIPAKQRALVNTELQQFYRGQAGKPMRVLSDLLRGRIDHGDSLLEIGCSSGYYMEILEYALKLELHYHGVDISEAMIAMAREYYPRGRFEVAKGACLPYPDRSMHTVVSGCVLLHDPHYAVQIKETCRVAQQWVIAHRTPICKARPTTYYTKHAYEVETVELRFNEQEFLGQFAAQGCVLADKIEYGSNPAADEYDVSYLFRAPR